MIHLLDVHFIIEYVPLLFEVDRPVRQDGCGSNLALLFGYFLDAHVTLGAVLGGVVWAQLEIEAPIGRRDQVIIPIELVVSAGLKLVVELLFRALLLGLAFLAQFGLVLAEVLGFAFVEAR